MTPLKVPLPDALPASVDIEKCDTLHITVSRKELAVRVNDDLRLRVRGMRYLLLDINGECSLFDCLKSQAPETADTSAAVPASPAGKSAAGEVSEFAQTGAHSAKTP